MERVVDWFKCFKCLLLIIFNVHKIEKFGVLHFCLCWKVNNCAAENEATNKTEKIYFSLILFLNSEKGSERVWWEKKDEENEIVIKNEMEIRREKEKERESENDRIIEEERSTISK